MNEQELIKKCLINEDAVETYPFKKILYINLKAEPETISILKDQYPESVTSAWHMNKSHWCKVDVNMIDEEVLDSIIKRSFEITASKKRSKKV